MLQTEKVLLQKFYALIQLHPDFAGSLKDLAAMAVDIGRLGDFLNSVKPVSTNHDLVRIGGDSDGGYLVPDDLEGVDVCFSPGVDRTAKFESELTARGIRCFLADYSVETAPTDNPLFFFEKKYLGTANDDVHMTLDSWVARNAPGQGDLILQMDIEGCEYPVISTADVAILRRFRIIVVEFHDLYRLCDNEGFAAISATFAKILQEFDVVHIHPNNNCIKMNYGGFLIPSLLEFTFLRKDRVLHREPAVHFPHVLDRQNIEGEDLHLPECWYR